MRLADRHAAGEAPVLTLEQYAPILAGFLERLRPDQCVHRIMSDSSKEKGLIAPAWSASKNASLMFLHNYLDRHDIVQGRLFSGEKKQQSNRATKQQSNKVKSKSKENH